MKSARLPLFLVALVACVVALTQARAAPLDAEACAKLQSEENELERAGVEKDMEKGPGWAKANLSLEKLQRVQRYIEIEQLLLFRCRSKAIVHLNPDKEWISDQDDDKDDKDDDKEAAPKSGKGVEAKQKQKPAPQPAAKPASLPKKAKAAAEPVESGTTSIEKRPPKPKVDDAYKAPPSDPSVNPFANQLNLPAK